MLKLDKELYINQPICVCLFVYFSSTQKHIISNQYKTDKYTERKKQKPIVRQNALDDDGALCTVARLIACWPLEGDNSQSAIKTDMRKITMTAGSSSI